MKFLFLSTVLLVVISMSSIYANDLKLLSYSQAMQVRGGQPGEPATVWTTYFADATCQTHGPCKPSVTSSCHNHTGTSQATCELYVKIVPGGHGGDKTCQEDTAAGATMRCRQSDVGANDEHPVCVKYKSCKWQDGFCLEDVNEQSARGPEECEDEPLP